jgi:hypothetical protein
MDRVAIIIAASWGVPTPQNQGSGQTGQTNEGRRGKDYGENSRMVGRTCARARRKVGGRKQEIGKEKARPPS